MSIETPSLEELQEAFHTKMNAAKFFFDQLKKIYSPESNLKEIPNELYYYVDAVIYEFHSASQILLQIVNVKSKLGLPMYKVKWGANTNFQKVLKENNFKLYEWWKNVNSSSQYSLLESVRQYIAHRGRIILNAAERDGVIIVLSFAVRFRYVAGKPESKATGKSIELLDEILFIADFLNEKYTELKKF